MQKMPFQRPKFQNISGGACPQNPLEYCRHYGLPLTKLLATPLALTIELPGPRWQRDGTYDNRTANTAVSINLYILLAGKY